MRLLATSIISGAAVFAFGAAANAATATTDATTTAAATSPAQVGEIIVTGTRIKGTTNQTSTGPVSVATQAQIQLTKADTIEEALEHVPGADFTGGISNASDNGGVGLSQIGLRNLGPARTLILVDGERLIPIFAGATSVPDLNSIPLEMVDHIEVLKDGASSIYGADAIGGVINIITKKNASGMTFDTSIGVSGHDDGLRYSLGATVATGSDRGNVMIGVSWNHQDEVPQPNRSWAISLHNGAGGSNFRGQLDLLQDENSDSIFANGLIFSQSNPILATLAPNLTFVPASGVVKLSAGGSPSVPWNDLLGSLETKEISFTGHYDITDNFRFVASGFFTERTSQQKLRPEPLLGDTIASSVNGQQVFAGFVVPDFAPGNPTGHDITAFLTPVQFGPRTYDQTSDTYRMRVGFEGTIANKWDWEAGYVEQDNHTLQAVANSGNFEHLAELTGQIACIDVPGGCVPNTLSVATGHAISQGGPATLPAVMPNFFQGAQPFSQAQLNYVRFTSKDNNQAYERYFYGNVSGSLFDLPAGTVKAAIGGEYRWEHLSDSPDTLVQEGWAANPTQPTSGGYNVGSVYGEMEIPVVKDRPFMQAITLNPSIRYDNFSTFGSSWTGKIGGTWKVSDDLMIRGSYSTGFRAPSTAELFGGTVISDLQASGDPCDTRANFNGNANAGTGSTAAGSQCAHALAGKVSPTLVFGAGGSIAAYASPQDATTDNQEQILIGGNPALKPELSTEYTVGGVFTPRFAPGLSLEIDYYNTTINNTILSGGFADAATSPGPDLILNGCYGPAQNQTFCNLITRNAAGTIVQINSLNANFGVEKVSGLEYELTYDTAAAHWEMPFPGSFVADIQLDQLLSHTSQNPDLTVNVAQGTFAYTNESIQPRWTGLFSLDYHQEGWQLHWDMRWLGDTVNLNGTAPGVGNQTPNEFYNDISASYTFHNLWAANEAKFTFGIDNLADVQPPYLSGDAVCKCNTLAGPFDEIGRFFYGRISTKF
jgi:outer membrane receptor protein involved in Fe transport